MLGLLSDLERKNCWTIAEARGDVTPYGLQHMRSRGSWDHGGVADDVRDYVTTAFTAPEAILVVDETGDLKKGAASVAVQRQYTGTAGRHRLQPSCRCDRGRVDELLATTPGFE